MKKMMFMAILMVMTITANAMSYKEILHSLSV